MSLANFIQANVTAGVSGGVLHNPRSQLVSRTGFTQPKVTQLMSRTGFITQPKVKTGVKDRFCCTAQGNNWCQEQVLLHSPRSQLVSRKARDLLRSPRSQLVSRASFTQAKVRTEATYVAVFLHGPRSRLVSPDRGLSSSSLCVSCQPH